MTLARRVSVVGLGVGLALGLAGLGVMAGGASATVGQPAATEAGAEAPELVLVKFHADWCPHCRKLNEPWAAVQAGLADEPVLFVKLDKTDKAKAKQAEYLTAELGLGGHWERLGKKTGLIVLFDARTGRVVREFTSSSDAAEIERTIAAELG
jgi:thiol-disulfide isomerase/thioredoxin